MSREDKDHEYRSGDSIEIQGDYQYRAMASRNKVQRFWHETKRLVIGDLLPPNAGDLVLDVGSGSGVISGFLGTYGADVTGIDANPRAIEFARQTFGSPNVHFHLGLVDKDLPVARQLDKIYCLELIEHLYYEQAKQLLSVFHSILAHGGRVFITTPNYRSFWPFIEWMMDRFHLAPEMSGKQHVSRFTPKRLYRIAEETGFRVDTLRTVSFLAPWLAPFSWSFANRMHGLEIRDPFHMGSIIVVVLSKQ